MFQIKDLSYKKILSIQEMVFEEGKVTSIIGESGAGKSTLLKMLNGLISPDHGRILFKGKDLKDTNFILHRREAVMLAQNPVIFEGNVRDNLLIGRKFSEKKPVDDEELKHALSFIKLDKELEDDAEDLSGGEKQRLALARVYIMDPDCYLLDEPTSALDEGTEEEIVRSFLEKVKGKTVIMVTHSNEIAEKYSDHVITLKKTEKDSEHER